MRKHVLRAKLALALVTACCCTAGAQVPIGTAPEPDHRSTHRKIVPFVTVRALEQNRKKGIAYFGRERGDVSAGDCTVDLHAREKRQIVGLELRSVDDVLDRSFASEQRMAVYVHGYNEGFEQSCRDAALLQDRIGPEPRLLLFSWPAHSQVAAYLHDVGDAEWSAGPLSKLIRLLADRFGAQNVDSIGHSLGTRAVVDAVMDDASTDAAAMLGRVVLIAPDLDVDVFSRNLPRLNARASLVTVYVSQQDRALKASRQVRDEPRLGEGGPRLAGLEGVDVVEVDQRHWRWGSLHEYHLTNEAVSDDLREVLSGAPHAVGSRIVGP